MYSAIGLLEGNEYLCKQMYKLFTRKFYNEIV